MTLEEINRALVSIQAELKKIDLTKEESAKVIEKMADKPIKDMEKISREKGFEADHLGVAADVFRSASESLESYDSKKEMSQAIGNKSKRQEIIARVQAKKAVQQKIKSKYEELTRKKEVFDKYVEKFDPQQLASIEQRKYNANEKKIENNEKRIEEIMDFKGRVNGELADINHNLKMIEELEALQRKFKELEDAKADFNAEKAKPNADKDFISQYQENINEQETQFKDQYKKVTEKYKSIKLDSKNLEQSINNTKNNAKKNIDLAKAAIDGKLTDAEKKYGYTSGFEAFVKGKISTVHTDKDYIKVFEEAQNELSAENINISFENDKIAENVETLREGQKVIQNGEPRSYTIAEPTEEEIQNAIESDSQIRALVPVLTKREMRQAVYDSLTQDKKGKFHPILFLKSFGKKAQSEWKESYEEGMRAEAIEKVKSQKREQRDKALENNRVASAVEEKEKNWREALFVHINNADIKEVDQMGKDADRAPGKVLGKVYNDMQKEDDERE